MKHKYTTYLYIITDPNTGSVYMGKIQHGNPDLEVVKQSIRADLFGAKCDTSDIILMDVTDRDTEAPDLIVALDGERDALRMAKYNVKTERYVMPVNSIRVEIEDGTPWFPHGDEDSGRDVHMMEAGKLFANQSGFNELDNLLDDNKRPLLQPDPTNATANRIKGHSVAMVSDATLANVTSGSGQTATTAADLFIGDGKQFATLFRCGSFELASTDIGGNAWRTDSTELRGIARLGVTKFDTNAMVRRSLTI